MAFVMTGIHPDERENEQINGKRKMKGEREKGDLLVNLAAPSISSYGFRIAFSWAKMRLSGVLAAKKREDTEEVGLREDVEEGGSRFAGIWV
ncbi:hypothetical protein L484_025353 [Morus notabilis]|uniref:Uncharacterized protein n=1 Tax=Morus notabilis TaxID=981085 RepID=W9RAD7_9ROSA|nr:hypothetical protein L484_025353 [Morus notabilis]